MFDIIQKKDGDCMFNFFIDENQKLDNYYNITGSDFHHIRNVLRMKPGDTFLVSNGGKSSLCSVTEFFDDYLTAEIIEENYQSTELEIQIYLFQGLPKSDKMELIIQKCVELGVYSIIPTEMNRCVVKLDEKKKQSKISRWQSIAESAAKQCKRNIIPEIKGVVSYKEALEMAKQLDLILLPYESHNGMQSTIMALNKIKSGMKIGIFIGPEGGFDDAEVKLAFNENAEIISLGKRILRTETAAITSVGLCMMYAEMTFDGEKND